MENRTLIIVVGFLGFAALIAFVAIALFYDGDKGVVFAGLTGLIVLFIPQLLSLKSSTDNATKLSVVSKQLDGNTEITNQTALAVDGRITQLIATVERLAEVKTALVGAESMAAGIVIGQNTPLVEPNPALAVETPKVEKTTSLPIRLKRAVKSKKIKKEMDNDPQDIPASSDWGSDAASKDWGNDAV